MKVRHLKAADFSRLPWKNGGGFMTELVRAPLWRVSIADVEQSGPFSDYTGFERTILLLSGDGMELEFDQAPSTRIDRREEPFVFDGGWKTHCRLLGGPVKDFNLMVIRESVRATLRVLRLPAEPTMLIAAPTALYYVLRGKAAFSLLGLDHVVAPGELLRVDDAEGYPTPARATEEGTAIVEIGITPVSRRDK